MPRRSLLTPAERASLLAFPTTSKLNRATSGPYRRSLGLSVRLFPFREVTPVRPLQGSRERGARDVDRQAPHSASKTLGRRRWKKASGYHRQSRVENTFFRYKSIIGDGLLARSPAGQGSEAVLGCEILNRMTDLGRPVSYRIVR